jgi:hypothetical protein
MKVVHSVLIGICTVLLVEAAGAAATVTPRVTVRCDENAQVADRITPDAQRDNVVFGFAALPTQTVPHEPVPADGGPRRYWTKMGLLIRLGRGPVDVVVPSAWRARVLITWGYPNLHSPSWSLRILRCAMPKYGTPYSDWLAYAGGVYFSEPACVPLTLRAGGRSKTIRLSLGRSCN